MYIRVLWYRAFVPGLDVWLHVHVVLLRCVDDLPYMVSVCVTVRVTLRYDITRNYVTLRYVTVRSAGLHRNQQPCSEAIPGVAAA